MGKTRKLNTEQVAALLGAVPGTIRQKARTGKIKAETVPDTYPVQWSFSICDLPKRKEKETDKAAYVRGVMDALRGRSVGKAQAELNRLIVVPGIMDSDTLEVFIEREGHNGEVFTEREKRP